MVGMRNFQDTFETRERSFISAFSICITVPLKKSDKYVGLSNLSMYYALDTHAKTIEQINFTRYLNQDGNTTFFIIEEAKETILDFPQGTVRVL